MAIANVASTKEKAGSWILLVLVLAGLITGLVLVAVFALQYILFYLLATAFVLMLLSVAFFLSYPKAYKPILLIFGVLILIGLVVASGFALLSIPIAVTVGIVVLPFLVGYAAKHQGYAPLLKWHLLDKGLGGSSFGDIANMVGVFAGIGAYRLVSGNPTLVKAWWWIGQFGAFFAAVVGLSLLWRWVHPDPGSPQDNQQAQKWPALFNWMVAAGTIVSLYSPTPDNRSFVRVDESGANGATAAIWWLVLLGLLVLAYFGLLLYRGKRFFEDAQAIVVSIAFLVVTIASAVTVGVALKASHDGADWSVAGTIIGMLAVLAWITSEFINYVLVTRGWKPAGVYIKVIDYLDWEKNLWEVIGGLGTILFIAGNTWRKTDWQNLNDYLFIIAASLGFLGTLRGIFRGILKQSFTDEYAQRAGFQEAQNANRGLIIQDHLGRINQLEHTVGQRDLSIQNLQQTLAQRNTVVQNLQQAVAQRDQAIDTRENHIDLLKFQLQSREADIATLNRRVSQKDAEIEKLRK